MTSKIITTERLFQKCRFCFGLICPNCFQLDLNTGTGPFKGYFSDSSFMLPRYIFEPWKQKGIPPIVTVPTYFLTKPIFLLWFGLERRKTILISNTSRLHEATEMLNSL
jgi:hypothetical protein